MLINQQVFPHTRYWLKKPACQLIIISLSDGSCDDSAWCWGWIVKTFYLFHKATDSCLYLVNHHQHCFVHIMITKLRQHKLQNCTKAVGVPTGQPTYDIRKRATQAYHIMYRIDTRWTKIVPYWPPRNCMSRIKAGREPGDEMNM